MIERFERFSLAISEISKYWHKLATEEMEKYDLKGSHSIYILAIERSSDGLTATEICEQCGKDKADVSRMMSIMENKGLVTKEGVYQNLYKGKFKLTKKGIEAAEHVKKRASIAVEIAGKDLTDEDRVVFYRSLETVAENLKILSKRGLPE